MNGWNGCNRVEKRLLRQIAMQAPIRSEQDIIETADMRPPSKFFHPISRHVGAQVTVRGFIPYLYFKTWDV